MNVKECANCRVHGWKQLENQDYLLTCSRCKLIKYCDKECQVEHWKKLHKRQCKYFAGTAKDEKSKHDEDTCGICLGSNYDCIYKSREWEALKASDLYHDHPFPVTGHSGDIKEKMAIIAWHLLDKFEDSQHNFFQNFKSELKKSLYCLVMKRLEIWQYRKIYPQPQYFNHDDGSIVDPQFWVDTRDAIKRGAHLANPFQIWETIGVLKHMSLMDYTLRMVNSLKDPLTTMPTEIRELVSVALINANKFTTIANQVLEALAHQVIPYQEVLKIICGGSLLQTCSLCSKEVLVTGIGLLDGEGPVVFFDYLFISGWNPKRHCSTGSILQNQTKPGMVLCGTGNCHAIKHSMGVDLQKVAITVNSAVCERDANRCDFCFLLSPPENVHRCSRCYTTMYCSKTCQVEDWIVHKEVCKEEEQERKIKVGKEGRRDGTKEVREMYKESLKQDQKEEQKINSNCSCFNMKSEQFFYLFFLWGGLRTVHNISGKEWSI